MPPFMGMSVHRRDRDTVVQAPPAVTKAVLMVGRTGHGKSRLGSFLVSPDNTETLDNVAFEFSEMPTSCTTKVATHPLTTWGSDGDRFEIIDTPGLGESPPRDFLHTVNLVRHLQNNPRLAGIVLCWRHGRCEDDARRLAKYLLQLFGKPTLETNLILVVTNVSHNERDIWQRKQRGTSIDTLLEMYHRQIKDAFQLEHDFQVIDIDTGPFGAEASEIARSRRDQILDLLASRPAADVANLAIPKTEMHKLEDKKVIDTNHMSRKEKMLILDKVEVQHQFIVQEHEKQSMASERLVKDITVLEDKISRLDTDELEKSGYKEGLRDVRDFLYSFKFGDFRLGGQHLQFDIESQFPIAKTHCTIINQERDSADRVEVLNTSECKRTVKVFPSHWTFGRCGVRCEVFSLKRVMHRVRISDMKAHMHTLQTSREDANRQLKGYQKQLEAIQHDFKPELFHKIDALEAENVKLALDTFNLAEAEARLPQLP